jgi:hypothetical protein
MIPEVRACSTPSAPTSPTGHTERTPEPCPHDRSFPTTTGRSASAPPTAAARLPMFHARAADQAHAASVPDTTWPVIGHPPGPAPAARSMATVSMPLRERNDTSTAVRVHSSSWSPPGTPPVPFPHRSPRRSSANAACGGLKPPPEGRLRRAYLHLSHSTDSRRLTYLIKTSVRRSWRTLRRSVSLSRSRRDAG